MTVQKFVKLSVALFAALAVTVSAADGVDSSDDFYKAIRENDLTRLAAMIAAGANVNVKESRGGLTPLMYAAEVGSADAMKLLLDHGADPNLKSADDATPLMWSASDAAKIKLLLARRADVNAVSKRGRTALFLAATYDNSAEIVRVLMSAGASAKVVDGMKMTTLNAATLGNDSETIRMLVDAGVDVNAPDFAGYTPLMNAAMNNNLTAVKLLLGRGASVNAVSGDGSFQKVKAGTIALGNWTPLLVAGSSSSAPLVQALLDAGANASARDVRGMTPLMLAVATDRQNPDVIRALMAKGSDVNAKSLAGETALDWAMKIGAAPAIEMLKRAGATAAAASATQAGTAAPADLKTSVERSAALLEKASVTFAAAGGCASCHSHNILDLTAAAVKAKGIRVDEKITTDRYQLTKAPFFSTTNLLERIDGPGSPDIAFYALTGLASSGYPVDRTVDAMVANTIPQQRADGRWTIGGVARPPIEDGDIFRTALGIRVIKAYGAPGRAAEFGKRIARASAWLSTAKPVSAQDRNMQLLGLYWAGAATNTLNTLAKTIRGAQRPDGGWSQTADLKSDAFATGQTLFALAEAGQIAPADAAYQKGVAYLLSTQQGDGSWYVRSRAPKFQPYFEGGFPHGHDQWISAMATGWATTALARALP